MFIISLRHLLFQSLYIFPRNQGFAINGGKNHDILNDTPLLFSLLRHIFLLLPDKLVRKPSTRRVSQRFMLLSLLLRLRCELGDVLLQRPYLRLQIFDIGGLLFPGLWHIPEISDGVEQLGVMIGIGNDSFWGFHSNVGRS